FQAEDGIRDRNVTGVQTCALPISTMRTCPGSVFTTDPQVGPLLPEDAMLIARVVVETLPGQVRIVADRMALLSGMGSLCTESDRSEERRVGKECRCVWWSCESEER